MKLPLSLPAASLILLAVPSAAACEPTTSDPEVDTGREVYDLTGERWYVDNDPCQPECAYSVWVYPETNGVDGLQRRDDVKDDTCDGQIEGDGWHPGP